MSPLSRLSQKWIFAFVLFCCVAYIYFLDERNEETDLFDSVKTKDDPIVSKLIEPALVAPAPVAIVPDPTPVLVSPPTKAPTKPERKNGIPGVTAPLKVPLKVKTDFSEISNLRQYFKLAKEKMVQGIKVDYGEYYDDLFTHNSSAGVSVSVGRVLFRSPSADGDEDGISWDRFKHKLMRKLFQVMNASDRNATVPFVWATGGHSVTAGHGNFVDESYTAVMERNVKSIFHAVGIDFVARNYAMSAAHSAPEAAWCIEEIFGNDLDVLVWDYA
jgi:hypothetical protein